jgi:hypothetical protein
MGALFLFSRFLHWRCGLGGGCAGAVDFDVSDLYVMQWTVIAGVPRHASDLFYKFDGSVVALTENCVATVEAGIGNFGDEKLRAVGVRAGVGIGEASGAVEFDVGAGFILEFVAGIAFTVPLGISTLNHEGGNDAMEDGAVVEGDAMLFGVSDGTGPILGAFGEADKIGDSERGDLGKKRAVEIADGSVDDGSGVGGRGGSRLCRGRRRLCEAVRGCGNYQGDYQDKGVQSSAHGCSWSVFWQRAIVRFIVHFIVRQGLLDRFGAGAECRDAELQECEGLLDASLVRSVGVDGHLRTNDGLEAGFYFQVKSEVTVTRGMRRVGSEFKTLARGLIGAYAFDDDRGLSEFVGELEDALDLVAAGEGASVEENFARGIFLQQEAGSLQHDLQDEVVLADGIFDVVLRRVTWRGIILS